MNITIPLRQLSQYLTFCLRPHEILKLNEFVIDKHFVAIFMDSKLHTTHHLVEKISCENTITVKSLI